ncbi:WYL domain-containing protein [Paenibacillus sp. P25]|nr:WYL domain-containing protein [Paenibacillus sp. P25]
MDFSPWGGREPDRERFEILREAIIGKQAISFTYITPYGDGTSRTAYPFKLVFKAKAWYLQGYCLGQEDFRTFKITRMHQIERLAESCPDQPPDPPPIEFSAETAYPHVHLKLRFAPEAAYKVYDEFSPGDITPIEDGSPLVSVRLPDDDWLYGFLLSFGTSARILEPRHVHDKLLEKLEAIKKIP